MLQEATNYRMGKLNGSVMRYHPNGKLVVEGYFKWDKQDSITRVFSDSEIKLEEGHYTKGVKVGMWYTF